MMARTGVALQWYETIYMKSKILKNAMQQIATSYFQPLESEFASLPSQSSFERNQITPTDLFLFHHHRLLRNYIIEHPASKQHIDAILEYMEERYGTEFADAENLFTRGLVTQAHVSKLFKPNEYIFSITRGRPAAYVVQEWPESKKDGSVSIACWSFQTNGSYFTRKKRFLSIPPLGRNTADIKALIAYPLNFVSPEIRESIQTHGEKQWKLGTTTHVTYKGWNVVKDQYFVCSDPHSVLSHSADNSSLMLDS